MHSQFSSLDVASKLFFCKHFLHLVVVFFVDFSNCPSINYCPISYLADFNGEIISFDEALVQLGPGSGASAQCKICGKVFSNIGNGRLHLQDIHYPRSVECLVCEKICGSVKKFRNHIADTHKIREKNVIQKYGKMLG